MRWLALGVLLLAGCAWRALPPAPAPVTAAPLAEPAPFPVPQKLSLPHYRCDSGIEFDVRFGGGSAELVFADREQEIVLRDAGGTLPAHTVYSSTRIKVEFGLGDDGGEARIAFAFPPRQSRCSRG